jgi:2-polyprenyl-6-methoxyphenol hydroxylase-like FAD-dependent oxidoreductase
MMRSDVLIVGAGPTGLVLAIWLAKQGVSVRIVDKAAEPGTTSRALAVQARTLELYQQADLATAVTSRGHRVPAVNLWARGEKAARIAFETIGEGLTPYPFLEIYPQDEHERLLIEALAQLGVRVERPVEVVGFEDDGGRVVAQLQGPDGETQHEAAYLCGCDGARSTVRETIGSGFPGGTYQQVFYVADVAASGAPIDGELHVDLDESDFLAIFPLAGAGRARLVGTVRGERAAHAETLTFGDVSERAIRNLKISVDRVNWFSTYRVHHRVTDRFRRGRTFLLGDAAHIHSPAGGQGMNTGIGDAINLAWKLAMVIGGRAPDRLLDSYAAERVPFAKRLVASTDRAFSFATASGALADLLRVRLAPVLISRLASIEQVRRFAFRTVSQITLNYRGGPLSAGVAGATHGGDRLPWVRLDEGDNFAPLSEARWQAHVYGAAKDDLVEWCERRGVALRAFAWREACGAVGLARDAAYLVRPDAYVALADPAASPAALEAYAADRGLVFAPASASAPPTAGG